MTDSLKNSEDYIQVNISRELLPENDEYYTENNNTSDQGQNQQIQPNINQPYLNKNKNQAYAPSYELRPMDKDTPGKIINSSSFTSEVSYGFSCVFSIYLIQSLIYIGIILFGKKYPESFTEEVTKWSNDIFIISSLILFLSIRKYNKEGDDDSGCAFILFVLFLIFKISFFIVQYTSMMGDLPKDSNIHLDFDMDTCLLYDNITVGVIYLALIIYSAKKKEISILISFGIGFLIDLISFGILYYFFGEQFATFVSGFVLIEIVFLFASIKVSKQSYILEEDSPIHNSVMIDYYKFLVIMILPFLIILLFFIAMACACSLIACLAPSETFSDSDGNIYDQYGDYMGITLTR